MATKQIKQTSGGQAVGFQRSRSKGRGGSSVAGVPGGRGHKQNLVPVSEALLDNAVLGVPDATAGSTASSIQTGGIASVPSDHEVVSSGEITRCGTAAVVSFECEPIVDKVVRDGLGGAALSIPSDGVEAAEPPIGLVAGPAVVSGSVDSTAAPISVVDAVGAFTQRGRSRTSGFIGAGRAKFCSDEGEGEGDLVCNYDSSRVAQLLSFQDESELLRATSADAALAHFGKIFASSCGSDSTYMMSAVTTKINKFISHNWSVGRGFKFVALACHLNFDLASVVAHIVSVLIAIIYLILPHFGTVLQNNLLYPCGITCRIVAAPVFFLVLFFAHDVRRCLGLSSASVFLDKTCISQVDKDEQRRAILKLGAFIHESEQMIVLYSEVYLLKLWTVYEVASFLVLQPLDQMQVVPVKNIVSYCIGVVICHLINICGGVVQMFSEGATYKKWDAVPAMIGVYCCFGFLWTITLRCWFREKDAVKSRLAEFSVKHCLCFVESDREAVSKNIVLLIRAGKVVDEGATDEQALEAFDQVVRDELPEAFSKVLSQRVFPTRYYMLCSFMLVGTRYLDYLGMLAHGSPYRYAAVCFLEYSFLYTTSWPAMFRLFEALTSCCMTWTGWWNVAWCVIVLFIIGPVVVAFTSLIEFLSDMARHSDVAMGLLIAMNLAGCVVSYVVMVGWGRWRRGDSHIGAERREHIKAATEKALSITLSKRFGRSATE